MVNKLYGRMCIEYGVWRGLLAYSRTEFTRLREIRHNVIRQEMTRLSEYK